MGDYHVHLHDHGPHRGHGPPPGEYPPGHIEAFVEHAAARGVSEVGFTEHLYRCVESGPVLGRFWESAPTPELVARTRAFIIEDRVLSLDRYVEAVVAAKDQGLPVLLGLEVDFAPDTIDAVIALLDPYPWDYLIGSVHIVNGWAVDNRFAIAEFSRRTVERAYADYFALETALAASGAVDVLAHVDLVKLFGHRPSEQPLDLYEKVVAAAAGSGTAVEVSTAGLHKPIAEMYPAAPFLEMFATADVPITLASDAHRPEDTARDFDQALELARSAGYTHRLRFTRRRATSVPLELL